MTPDDRVRKLAASQNGYITGAQARGCGVTHRQLQARRRSGGWTLVLPDVYRMPGVPVTYEGTMRAVQLWMGEDGFFCGPTAAYLHKLDGVQRPQTISVSRYSGARNSLLRVYRLHPDDRPRTRWVNGLKVCNVERTVAEIAGVLSPKAVGEALDGALRERKTTLDRMWRFLEQEWGRGRPGARVLRQLLKGRDHRDEKVRSAFETQMLKILKRIKDHNFEPNYKVSVAGRNYILDFFLASAQLGIECHSRRWHDGHDSQSADAKRDRMIGSLGIEILYFTWDEVFFDPDRVEAEIRSAIARRHASLPFG